MTKNEFILNNSDNDSLLKQIIVNNPEFVLTGSRVLKHHNLIERNIDSSDFDFIVSVNYDINSLKLPEGHHILYTETIGDYEEVKDTLHQKHLCVTVGYGEEENPLSISTITKTYKLDFFFREIENKNINNFYFSWNNLKYLLKSEKPSTIILHKLRFDNLKTKKEHLNDIKLYLSKIVNLDEIYYFTLELNELLLSNNKKIKELTKFDNGGNIQNNIPF